MEIDSRSNYQKDNKNNEKDSIGKVTGFFLFRNLIDNYNRAKESSEEERKSIKKYGVLSIILSTISIIISASCLISTFMNFEFFGFSYFLLIIAYVLGGIIVGILLSIYAFVFGVMQVRLNRKAIGIFGIVMSVLGMISCVALLIVLIV